jgi:5-methylthioadenosine/S-adenosylhomocysteine deaminase
MEKTGIDLLITDGAILTMDQKNKVLEKGSIAINGNKIVAIGSPEEISSAYTAKETMDARGQVIMPGMVDTHMHTGQQFERSILYHLSKEMKLKEPVWQNYLISFEGSLTDEDINLSALFAYANMLKVGTTCFADPGGPHPEMMAPAIEKTGIRGVLARSTLDLKEGIVPEMQDTPAGIVEKGERFFKEWNGKANDRIRVWMGMRQIMVCSEELLKTIKQLADHLHTGIHIHLDEGAYEVDYSILKSGLRPAEYLDSIGFLGPNVHAAHSVLMSDRELDLYQQYDVSVAHCPAPVFTYCGVTRVPEMLRRGLRVGLGTDGALSSGGSLDLFRQMNISFVVMVATYGLPFRNPAPILPDDLLRMATIGGANALSWGNEIGSLEVGKKADLILLNREDIDVLPSYDPMHTVASNACASQVTNVVVDGKVVVKNGKLLTIDEEMLKEKIKERAPKILPRFLERLK